MNITMLFLWAVILPILPIIYFTLKNECKPKKNIIVGVTLPYEARNDVSVLAFLERYKKELKLTCWGFLAIIVPCLFIQSFSVSMTVWLTWIVLVCVVFFIPYIRCNKNLRQLKEERGWRQKEAPQVVTDLKWWTTIQTGPWLWLASGGTTGESAGLSWPGLRECSMWGCG